jgi:hypothetical protein
MNFSDDRPVVDFDYFWFESDKDNREVAKEIAMILIDETDVDELKGMFNEDKLWDSSVGTGGSGGNYPCTSQSAQRATLASHFASYANRKYTSCYLSLYELTCLQELVTYMEDDCSPAQHREKIHNAAVDLLKETCQLFIKAYVKEDPTYHFTLLKNS